MPKATNYPDPNGATTIGASVAISRIAAGATGVAIVYNPNNKDPASGLPDSPFETNITVLSAGARTNLAAIIAELDAAYKAAKGYT